MADRDAGRKSLLREAAPESLRTVSLRIVSLCTVSLLIAGLLLWWALRGAGEPSAPRVSVEPTGAAADAPTRGAVASGDSASATAARAVADLAASAASQPSPEAASRPPFEAAVHVDVDAEVLEHLRGAGGERTVVEINEVGVPPGRGLVGHQTADLEAPRTTFRIPLPAAGAYAFRVRSTQLGAALTGYWGRRGLPRRDLVDGRQVYEGRWSVEAADCVLGRAVYPGGLPAAYAAIGVERDADAEISRSRERLSVHCDALGRFLVRCDGQPVVLTVRGRSERVIVTPGQRDVLLVVPQETLFRFRLLRGDGTPVERLRPDAFRADLRSRAARGDPVLADMPFWPDGLITLRHGRRGGDGQIEPGEHRLAMGPEGEDYDLFFPQGLRSGAGPIDVVLGEPLPRGSLRVEVGAGASGRRLKLRETRLADWPLRQVSLSLAEGGGQPVLDHLPAGTWRWELKLWGAAERVARGTVDIVAGEQVALDLR